MAPSVRYVASVSRKIRAVAALVVSVLLSMAAPVTAQASTKITFYLGLDRPESKAQKQFKKVGNPSSSSYRNFLSQSKIANKYGGDSSAANKISKFAKNHDLKGTVDDSNVFARLKGTKKKMQKIFSTEIKKQKKNGVTVFSADPSGLKLSSGVKKLVDEKLTVYALQPSGSTSSAKPRPPTASASANPTNDGTWSEGCSAARATGGYGWPQLRTAYGVTETGSGARVGILNFAAGVSQNEIDTFTACFDQPSLTPNRPLTDGFSEPVTVGDVEAELDLAAVRGASPELASLILPQGSDQAFVELLFLPLAKLLNRGNLPHSISISYGLAERNANGSNSGKLDRKGASLADAIFTRLGLAGVGSYVASGDSGSAQNGQLDVSWPASSPYVTSVGGTRLVLNGLNQRVQEVVWNDMDFVPPAKASSSGAGSGGYSQVYETPAYQDDAGLNKNKRGVPDISGHASNYPGVPIYVDIPSMKPGWYSVGGTSGSTPFAASSMAAISAREEAAGRPRLGNVNGLLYKLAEKSPATIFDITQGNNEQLPGVKFYSAGPGYDLASGLGVPDYAAVEAALPPPGG